MKIGLSYWGFCEKFGIDGVAKTPDGLRHGRPILINAAIEKGHKVFSLQKKRDLIDYPGLIYDEQFPDLDILFLEWRWPTHKNFGKNKTEPDLDRQNDLMHYYYGKIPIIIFDCDYKLAPEEEIKWSKAIIAEPSFSPKFVTRKRQRLMFWSDWKTLLPVFENPVEYGYIGNNYERPEAFKKYYSDVAKDLRLAGIQTSIHGNWLEKSPERESPKDIIKRNEHCSFMPRLNFYESMKRLNSFICTTHITKKDYAANGLIACRYFENIAVGTPALVPQEFLVSDILGKEWIAKSSLDTYKKTVYIQNLQYKDRVALVSEQQNKLKNMGIFSVDNVIEFFESLI